MAKKGLRQCLNKHWICLCKPACHMLFPTKPQPCLLCILAEGESMSCYVLPLGFVQQNSHDGLAAPETPQKGGRI